ncbi:hypothetical protein INN71_08175 [Nocardioides sp. ChNu-153]|uniref:hypothetical protein n=1 Tax=unclassified Nocardioides TaxID=2615069 RepID=UPI002404BB2A|nr:MULTISPECIES: hypothetical protein [unclassified Nocardioides]MDF9717318.1 hypothetical protein [Nocardioides sp. ChNu-99]MDN7121367.1 hypothetical protein [Nocardioides sp. ChNu-153]
MSLRRTAPFLPALALGLVALAGCSEVETAVRDAASDAGCSLAQDAVDGVTGQAHAAADQLGVDPAGAERELTALRDGLATAEQGLSGELRGHVEDARTALDALVTQARAAADGTVDQQAVAEAEAQLDTAVQELTTVC